MKTPRQILFKHYSPIDARLEQIQERAIASTLRTARDRIPASTSTSLILICGTLWRELFQPLQRMWAVFAVAWVAIIAINLSNGSDRMNPPLSRQESKAHFKAWKEQQRILVELNQTIEMPTFDSPEPIAPQPTVQNREVNKISPVALDKCAADILVCRIADIPVRRPLDIRNRYIARRKCQKI